MPSLLALARHVRHHPRLEGADWLWDRVRGLYHWVLDPFGRGVSLRVGGHCPVRIPADLTALRWEVSEPEEFACLGRWIGRHPDGLIIDIGCAVGIFSAAALFASGQVDVVGIEPDRVSLAVTRRMTRYAPNRRLRLVHGFISSKPSQTATLDTAVSHTQAAMAQQPVSDDLKDARFRSLRDGGATVPAYRLDDLFAQHVRGRAILIKCDVEGAELDVLMSASQMLRRLQPDILLSVHAWKDFGLPQFGHSKSDVERFLHDHGYRFHVVGIDHEEHWLCQPQERADTLARG